jgi:hypothetical protein
LPNRPDSVERWATGFSLKNFGERWDSGGVLELSERVDYFGYDNWGLVLKHADKWLNGSEAVVKREGIDDRDAG